ncbi:hypothetical protein U1Q18_049453 [Sarracenia purpurea var. burkii]
MALAEYSDKLLLLPPRTRPGPQPPDVYASTSPMLCFLSRCFSPPPADWSDLSLGCWVSKATLCLRARLPVDRCGDPVVALGSLRRRDDDERWIIVGRLVHRSGFRICEQEDWVAN